MGIKVINDIVLIEEDAQEYERNDASGLTEAVVKSLKESKLVLPDAYESFAKKFPDRGTIISWGDKCKYTWEAGTKVLYGKYAGERFEHKGIKLIRVREYDIHSVIS